MAILSRKHIKDGPSGSSDFNKLEDKVWGGNKGRINKKKDFFNCDYIYLLEEVDGGDYRDTEIGINKEYQRAHDEYLFDHLKNENFAHTKSIVEMLEEAIESGEIVIDSDFEDIF